MSGLVACPTCGQPVHPRGRGGRALNAPTVLAAFRRDWDADVLIATMARRYGISASTVQRTARQLGLKPRRVGRRPQARLNDGRWASNGAVQRWIPTPTKETP